MQKRTLIACILPFLAFIVDLNISWTISHAANARFPCSISISAETGYPTKNAIELAFQTNDGHDLSIKTKSIPALHEKHIEVMIGDARLNFGAFEIDSPEALLSKRIWRTAFLSDVMHLSARTGNTFVTGAFRDLSAEKIIEEMERECGLLAENATGAVTDNRSRESQLGLIDAERAFLIWALKQRGTQPGRLEAMNLKFDASVRAEILNFRRERGLRPSRYLDEESVQQLSKAAGFSIQPRFEKASNFYRESAAVRLAGLWGLIDKRGKWVLRPRFTDVGEYRDGYLVAVRGGRWGIVDYAGTTVAAFRYEEIKRCSSEMCLFRTGNRWGYIDLRTRSEIPATFDAAQPFRGNLAAVRKGHRWMLIDRSGRRTGPMHDVETLYSPAEGMSAFKANNGRRGFMRPDGRVTVGAKYTRVRKFSEGLAGVFDGKRWGFVDGYGNLQIGFGFEWVREFGDGVAPAMDPRSQKWGYVDRTGRWAIRPQFTAAYSFQQGVATVRVPHPVLNTENRAFIDLSGKFLYPPIFEDVYRFNEGVAPVQMFDRWGYLDESLIGR